MLGHMKICQQVQEPQLIKPANKFTQHSFKMPVQIFNLDH
jgi:hypothetical protein